MIMHRQVLVLLLAVVSGCAFLSVELPAQRENQAQNEEDSAYGSKFFDQLHNIFGRFRDADLRRVFQDARPIECTELVGHKGAWRTVAFFNEDRKLGDWCRESLEEVKADLAVYTFTGNCGGGGGRVQVATEFPTTASIEAYNRREIDWNQIDITVNEPVDAVLNPRTMAHTFDLPYLFLTGRRGEMNLYGLNAPDRQAAYATNVAARWECKSVVSKDLTYRFLICRATTVPRGAAANRRWEPSFGTSAYYVLSDGTEAQTSVHLSFGDCTTPREKPADAPPGPASRARPTLKKPQKANPPGP